MRKSKLRTGGSKTLGTSLRYSRTDLKVIELAKKKKLFSCTSLIKLAEAVELGLTWLGLGLTWLAELAVMLVWQGDVGSQRWRGRVNNDMTMFADMAATWTN